MFEAGLTLHFERQTNLLYKLLSIRKLQKPNLNSFKLDENIFNNISFDVIKRGHLLIILIGFILSCIIFILEVTLFYSMN